MFDIEGLCKGVPQRALFVDGQRRDPRRVSKLGLFCYSGRAAEAREANVWVDAFQFGDDLKPETFKLNADSELIAYHYWSASRHGVMGIDTEHSSITLNGLTSHSDDWARYGKSEKYYLLNVRSGPLLPGHWIQQEAKSSIVLQRPN